MVYEDTNFCFLNGTGGGEVKRGFYTVNYLTKNVDLSKSIFIPNINFNYSNYSSLCTKDNKSMMMR